MASIKDVAEAAGVSIATVSRALSGRGNVSASTLAAVRRAAHELDYVVSASASGLASGRTRNIGVLVPMINRWYYGSVLEGISAALMREGYDTTLYQLSKEVDQREKVFSDFLLRQRVDAVIAVNVELGEAEMKALHALDKPLVGVGGPLPGAPTLFWDEEAVAALATEHLIALGHTRIAHIGGSQETDQDFHLPTRRRAGYERAMREASLPVDDRLYLGADFSMAQGYQAAKQLLGHPVNRPTAIFAASDEMAIGAMLAARDLGLQLPHDLSVIGIDNHELADMFGLTTIEQRPHQQGETAVAMLLRTIRGLEPAQGHPIEHRLIVRSSTTRPPA
ncbi:LacI family DNA-binding transcriptional regulator [Glutamicibacter sp.]|uniref:LacI family DNA-binding transcriptional regulator n=1 Tax=Glutamicibacter sp. TaxID=1931995 RepID=UPI002B47F488|nr:LacI family DNA-binding transcriptional regulator [Glutamicibacter sp.]HJX79646.1 LacI family DNA-binding transcriptional regulator [Glutamicibacter sp.]